MIEFISFVASKCIFLLIFTQEMSRNGPPKSQMEMSVMMTGRERRQYTEWKSEREAVDQARMERQKNNAGGWRRAWDTEKKENQ